MKTPKYVCARCKLPFSRKWNAMRHCNNKHSGVIENIVSFTEFVINHKDSASYSNGFINQYPLKNQSFYDSSSTINNTSSNTLQDLFNKILETELSPYEILQPLGPKYEEIRRILEYLPEPTRKIILGSILSTAINSSNPLETMYSQFDDLRKNNTNLMMFNDLKSFYGFNDASMKAFLNSKWKYNRK